MTKLSTRIILGCVIWLTIQSASKSAELGEGHIDYVSGGLMSPHIEIRLDLASGSYLLSEPKSGFTPIISYDGHLSGERLSRLRKLAGLVVTNGFENEKCRHDKKIEQRRFQRLAKHGIFEMPRSQSMDSQLSFRVTFAGKNAAAPFDTDCWSNTGAVLNDEMFKAVRDDAYHHP